MWSPSTANGWATTPGRDPVRVEDGRLGLRRLAGSQDLVVGDAFGGISVPWHLTTRRRSARSAGCWPATGPIW